MNKEIYVKHFTLYLYLVYYIVLYSIPLHTYMERQGLTAGFIIFPLVLETLKDLIRSNLYGIRVYAISEINENWPIDYVLDEPLLPYL